MNNLKKAKKLEAYYLKQINALIEQAGGQNQLSIFLYGNENTLQSKLSRAKKSSPYKLMTLVKILEDWEAYQIFISSKT